MRTYNDDKQSYRCTLFMGMFDTIVFDQPIACKHCGALVNSTQTKQFDSIMDTFMIGDILPGQVVTGVIKESLFCDHPAYEKNKKPPYFDQDIFLAVWHHVLVGVHESYETAEQASIHFGIGDLRLLYDRVSEDRDKAIHHAGQLEAFLRQYAEFMALPETEKQSILDGGEKGILGIHWIWYRDFLKQPDPVKAFLDSLERIRRKSLIF
jgi:hypothetical protein